MVSRAAGHEQARLIIASASSSQERWPQAAYRGEVRRMYRVPALIVALSLTACAAPPPPPPPPQPAAPAADTNGARTALDVALKSLAKRNFDVSECAPADLRVVEEAVARAGEPIGDKCTLLVARRADQTWLVNVRPATRATPSRAGGSQALVTVTSGGEGVKHIDYVK
ncbi:Hypothetical protein A7982_06011 [Minicystis rosea]|nr:Hypothetical protein A7982_06011 [Minicystis rosea]